MLLWFWGSSHKNAFFTRNFNVHIKKLEDLLVVTTDSQDLIAPHKLRLVDGDKPVGSCHLSELQMSAWHAVADACLHAYMAVPARPPHLLSKGTSAFRPSPTHSIKGLHSHTSHRGCSVFYDSCMHTLTTHTLLCLTHSNVEPSCKYSSCLTHRLSTTDPVSTEKRQTMNTN